MPGTLRTGGDLRVCGSGRSLRLTGDDPDLGHRRPLPLGQRPAASRRPGPGGPCRCRKSCHPHLIWDSCSRDWPGSRSKCQLRPANPDPLAAAVRKIICVRQRSERLERLSRPVRVSNGSPAGSRRTRPAISDTCIGSSARQIAGSVRPKQPLSILRSAHRTAAPRAYPTGGSATLGNLLADGNRGSGGRS
jgi:hypothetical protein